ncbi:pyridine nucleotide-disulfide oxidoreductase family protein, partial [Chlamydia psittaci 06-1683]
AVMSVLVLFYRSVKQD